MESTSMAELNLYELVGIFTGSASLASWFFGGLTEKEHKKKWLIVTLIFVFLFILFSAYSFIGDTTSLTLPKLGMGIMLVIAGIQITFFRFNQFPQPLFLRLKGTKLFIGNLIDLIIIATLVVFTHYLIYQIVSIIPSSQTLHKALPTISSVIILIPLIWLLFTKQKRHDQFQEQIRVYSIEAAKLLNSQQDSEKILQVLNEILQKSIINWLERGDNQKNLVTTWILEPDYQKQQFNIVACYTGNQCKKQMNPENCRVQGCHPPFYGSLRTKVKQGEQSIGDYGSELAHYFFESYSFRRDRLCHDQRVFLTQVGDDTNGLSGLIHQLLYEQEAIKYSVATAWISNVFVNFMPNHLQNNQAFSDCW